MNFPAKFRADHQLGSGGFAIVYKADPGGGAEHVALKLAKNTTPGSTEMLRIEREITIQRTVESPHVMEILDFDVTQGWFTMPIAFGDLDALAIKGVVRPTDTQEIFTVVTHVALGLEKAHQLGHVHRDVTPRNILRVDDEGAALPKRWVIADWGLVSRPPGHTTFGITEHNGNAMGTPGYAAPETNGEAHTATAAADIYSLARVAYRLLSGAHPYETARAEVPTGWRLWIHSCTHHDAKRRPQSIHEAMELLDTYLHPSGGSPLSEIRDGLSAEADAVTVTTWQLVSAHAGTTSVYRAVVRSENHPAAVTLGAEHPRLADAIVSSFCDLMEEDRLNGSGFERYNNGIIWVFHVIKGLLRAGHHNEAGEAAYRLFRIDNLYNQFATRNIISSWLARLNDPSAEVMARSLLRSEQTEWYREPLNEAKSSYIEEALGL